jgi:acyl-CoA thioesterase-2
MSGGAIGNSVTLAERMTLDRISPETWRSRHSNTNQNGRSYGGQLLGQALHAALLDESPEREPTMMQFLFLQGAMPDKPVDYTVSNLQTGKRFHSIGVHGTQGERTVLQAQVSCALPIDGPTHSRPSLAPADEEPESLPHLAQVSSKLRDQLALMGGYGRDINDCIEFRIPDAERQLTGATADYRFRFWIRVPHHLPDVPRMQAACFAYLSDWWINFCNMAPHLKRAGERPLYITSLNHSVWLHRLPRCDGWLHVASESLHAAHGRGFSIAHYHDLEGRHIATASQDCLLAYGD